MAADGVCVYVNCVEHYLVMIGEEWDGRHELEV